MKLALLSLFLAACLVKQAYAIMCYQCNCEGGSPDDCKAGEATDCGNKDCVSWSSYRNGKPYYARGCMPQKKVTCEKFGAKYIANSNKIYNGSYPFWCERCDYDNCNKCKIPEAQKPA